MLAVSTLDTRWRRSTCWRWRPWTTPSHQSTFDNALGPTFDNALAATIGQRPRPYLRQRLGPTSNNALDVTLVNPLGTALVDSRDPNFDNASDTTWSTPRPPRSQRGPFDVELGRFNIDLPCCPRLDNAFDPALQVTPTIGGAFTAGVPFTTGPRPLGAIPDLCNSCSTRRLDNCIQLATLDTVHGISYLRFIDGYHSCVTTSPRQGPISFSPGRASCICKRP